MQAVGQSLIDLGLSVSCKGVPVFEASDQALFQFRQRASAGSFEWSVRYMVADDGCSSTSSASMLRHASRTSISSGATGLLCLLR